ncbi:hypothetical protein ABIC65_000001 [Sphingomonas trueperi]
MALKELEVRYGAKIELTGVRAAHERGGPG